MFGSFFGTTNHDYDRLDHSTKEHKDYVVVNWCVTNVCNYECSYCPDDLHNGKSGFPTLEQVLNFSQKVINHYAGRKVYFEFTGGEVTLWKDLPTVAKFLKERNCKIGIISNGSRSVEFWNSLVDSIDHVCLSFHPESAKEDHFLEIVKLCSEKIRTHVNFMMAPHLFNKVLAFAMKVKDVPNISIAIQPLVVNFGEELFDYTAIQKTAMEKQWDLVIKHIKYTKNYECYRGAMQITDKNGNPEVVAPQKFVSMKGNSWKGWHCYAGLEQIVINLGGEIYRGWCLVGGKIGNVKDAELKLPTRPVVCNKDFCHCNLDIMTTKVHPRAFKEIKNDVFIKPAQTPEVSTHV